MIRQGDCFHYVLVDPASSIFINSTFQYGVSKGEGRGGEVTASFLFEAVTEPRVIRLDLIWERSCF